MIKIKLKKFSHFAEKETEIPVDYQSTGTFGHLTTVIPNLTIQAHIS